MNYGKRGISKSPEIPNFKIHKIQKNVSSLCAKTDISQCYVQS